MKSTVAVRAASIAILLSVSGATLAAAATPRLPCKPGTLNMSSGVATWKLKGPGGVGPFAVVVTSPPSEWAPNQGGASWIAPTADGDPSAPSGRYIYTAKLNVGSCKTSSTVTLSGFTAGDNGATVSLDGNIVGITKNFPDGFEAPNPTSFNNIVVPAGSHVLKVVVVNTGGWTGTLLQAIFTRGTP